MPLPPLQSAPNPNPTRPTTKRKGKEQPTSQRGTNIHNKNLLALLILALQGYRIRHDDPTQRRARVQLLDRVAAEYAVRDYGDDFGGAARGELLGGRAERAAGVGHVVDEDGRFAGYFAGEGHAGDFAGLFALFA